MLSLCWEAAGTREEGCPCGAALDRVASHVRGESEAGGVFRKIVNRHVHALAGTRAQVGLVEIISRIERYNRRA